MTTSNLRATEDALAGLHGALAVLLKEEIQGYKDRGEPVPASIFAQAIKFLKDNGIDAPAQENNEVDELKNELADIDFQHENNVVSFS